MITLVVLVGAALLLLGRGVTVADTVVCLGVICGLAAALTATTASAPGAVRPAAVEMLHVLLSGNPTRVTEAWT